MNISKLRETTAELRSQRRFINAAIESLDAIIASQNGGYESGESGRPLNLIDTGRSVLQRYGKPMPMKELVFEVGNERGKAVSRNSLQASLSRHAKEEGENARIIRLGPGIFGLAEWPEKIRESWPEAAK